MPANPSNAKADPIVGIAEFDAMLENMEARAWRWGHGCSDDDISDRRTIGDSYNEGGRDQTAKARKAIADTFRAQCEQIERLTLSRDRTRAALEVMRPNAQHLEELTSALQAAEPYVEIMHSLATSKDTRTKIWRILVKVRESLKPKSTSA